MRHFEMGPISRRLTTIGIAFAGLLAAGGCTALGSTPGTPVASQGGTTIPQTLSAMPICQSQNDPSQTQCSSWLNLLISPNPNPTLPPLSIQGYHPSDLQSAYGLTSASKSSGSGQTVAVITADLELGAEADLAVYRLAFGLGTCTQLNHCLKIVQMPGLPGVSAAWATETALDVEMISALCPKCKILIVAAPDDHVASLAAAVDRAASLGATVIDNSYAAVENASNAAYESHYHHKGVAIVAGAGDAGYGVSFPASSPHVTAVGGTTLTKGTWQQTVWPNTGSGCSAYFAKPNWQTDKGCAMRTANDTAAVADPMTGVAMWSIFAGGWVVVGGTSVAAPIVSSMYALAGNTGSMQDASGLYAHPGAFASITGSNGTCSSWYLCNAGPGYNGPAGLGVPSGLGAF